LQVDRSQGVQKGPPGTRLQSGPGAGLRPTETRAENGAVRKTVRISAWALLLLGLCLAGAAQSQDRDPSRRGKSSAAVPAQARTDINRASLDELLKVPGMTPSWAGRIVRFRPYHSKLDLLEHGVLNSQVYDRIEGYLIAHREKQGTPADVRDH